MTTATETQRDVWRRLGATLVRSDDHAVAAALDRAHAREGDARGRGEHGQAAYWRKAADMATAELARRERRRNLARAGAATPALIS